MEQYTHEFEEITPDKVDVDEMIMIQERSRFSKIEKIWAYRARKVAKKPETGYFAHVTKDNQKYTVFKHWENARLNYGWYCSRKGWLDIETYLSVKYDQYEYI